MWPLDSYTFDATQFCENFDAVIFEEFWEYPKIMSTKKPAHCAGFRIMKNILFQFESNLDGTFLFVSSTRAKLRFFGAVFCEFIKLAIRSR